MNSPKSSVYFPQMFLREFVAQLLGPVRIFPAGLFVPEKSMASMASDY